jgi:hypothetical protein
MTEKEIELRERFTYQFSQPYYDGMGEIIQRTQEEVLELVNNLINQEKTNLVKWDILKTLIDQKLENCDWTQLEDAPITEDLKAQWATYRQALSDLPDTVEFPAYADLPRFPGEIRPEDEDFIKDRISGEDA